MLLCLFDWWIVFDVIVYLFFFFKQKTAYEMRISDWSSDVCSSDLLFTPLGLTMIAPSFASLLTMFEAAAGRPIEIGARDRPSQDQLAICAILTTANAPAVPFLPDMLEPSHPLSSTIDCAEIGRAHV